MGEELIAMCDCPEIQGRDDIAKPVTQSDIETVDGRWIQKLGEWLFLPSVSWLLREIEGNLKECEHLQLTSVWIAELHEGHSPYLSDLLCSSSAQDSPEKALLHVFMWQKGRVWKDGEWVKS